MTVLQNDYNVRFGHNLMKQHDCGKNPLKILSNVKRVMEVEHKQMTVFFHFRINYRD